MDNNFFKKTFGTPSKYGQHRQNWAKLRQNSARRSAPRRPTPRKSSPKTRASSINNFNRAPRTRQTLNLYIQKWIGHNSRGNKLRLLAKLVHNNKNPVLTKNKQERLVRLFTELLVANRR